MQVVLLLCRYICTSIHLLLFTAGIQPQITDATMNRGNIYIMRVCLNDELVTL